MARTSRNDVDSEASSDGAETGESSQATDRCVILLGRFVKPSLSDIDFEPITDQEDGDSMGGGNSTNDSLFKLIAGVTGDRIGYASTDDGEDEEAQGNDDEEAQKDASANAASSTSDSSTDSMCDTSKGSKDKNRNSLNLSGKGAKRRYYPCVRLTLLALIAGGTLVVLLNKLGVIDNPIDVITTAVESMSAVTTEQPSSQPTGSPSSQPSGVPSSQPSGVPSAIPTLLPTSEPTSQPSVAPSAPPGTSQPSVAPSAPLGTSQPSVAPSAPPGTSEPMSLPPSKEPLGIELILFNIRSGQSVASLEDVDLLNVTELGSDLSIRVELPGYENVTSVLFFFDNELVRNDTESPYLITTEYFTSAYAFPKLSENGTHTLFVVVSSASRFVEKGLASATFTTVGGQPAANFDSNPPTGSPTAVSSEEDGKIEATNAPTKPLTVAPTQSPSTIVSTTDATADEATNEDPPEPQKPPSESVFAGFTLIDANSNQEIMPVFDGDEVNLDTLGTTSLNLRADVHPLKSWAVDEVTFTYGTGYFRREKIPPYAMGRDNNGNYNSLSWLSAPGIKDVTVAASITGREKKDVYAFQFSMIDGGG